MAQGGPGSASEQRKEERPWGYGDNDWKYYRYGFEHGKQILKNLDEENREAGPQCDIGAKVHLTHMLIPLGLVAEDGSPKYETQPLEGHDCATAYIVGFVSATGVVCLDLPCTLWNDTQKKALEQACTDAQEWQQIFDILLWVEPDEQDEARQAVKTLWTAGKVPEGATRDQGVWSNGSSFWQTELKPLYQQNTQYFSLSDAGERKQHTFEENSPPVRWADKVNQEFLGRAAGGNAIKVVAIDKTTTCVKQGIHADVQALYLPSEGEGIFHPQYFGILAPVLGNRTLTFWPGSHLLTAVGAVLCWLPPHPCMHAGTQAGRY